MLSSPREPRQVPPEPCESGRAERAASASLRTVRRPNPRDIEDEGRVASFPEFVMSIGGGGLRPSRLVPNPGLIFFRIAGSAVSYARAFPAAREEHDRWR